MQHQFENNNNINYNHVFNHLQDYMLTEENIQKFLEPKMDIITKNIERDSNDNEKNANAKPLAKSIAKPKNNIYIPREKDTLFWCFYIMKYGDAKYEILENKNILVEKKIKIEYVEKIRKEKQIVKTYKFATLTHIENNLANENNLDIKTFLSLCAVENLNILFVKNKTYYELLMNDTNELHIVHLLQNQNAKYGYKYGYEINTVEHAEQIKKPLYKLDNIDKPIKSIAGYKLSELVEICNKLAIDTINKETNKNKNKKDLYESIIQYF